MSNESNYLERKNQAKQLCIETSFVLDISKNINYKNQATITPKFRLSFTKKIKKSIKCKFLILASTHTTSYKQKNVDIEGNNNSLLKISPKKKEKSYKKRNDCY